jgi:hypothetical protein
MDCCYSRECFLKVVLATILEDNDLMGDRYEYEAALAGAFTSLTLIKTRMSLAVRLLTPFKEQLLLCIDLFCKLHVPFKDSSHD